MERKRVFVRIKVDMKIIFTKRKIRSENKLAIVIHSLNKVMGKISKISPFSFSIGRVL
jgi:hypothetical protein